MEDNNNDLKTYYNGQLSEMAVYLDAQLEQLKNTNKEHLLAQMAQHIENAKALFERANKIAFQRFHIAMDEAERSKQDGYPFLVKLQEDSAKNNLQDSLTANKKIVFENLLAFYKNNFNSK